MLRYPSTKQILTVAVLSALLAGCGKDSKKATADSNIMDTPPMAERPEASIVPVDLGTELELTNESDVARQNQAVALAAIVLTTTLNMDKGSSAVKEAISVFAGAKPRDTATGAMSPVLGGTTTNCSKSGKSTLTLLMGEGVDVQQSGAFNREEVYFDADFDKCDLGAAKIDGGLGMSLSLGIAELINSASFRIETSLIAQNLKVDRAGSTFLANGGAGYKFYTNNGYELNNEFYADNFELDAGLNMNLIDLFVKQVNNTANNDWSMSVQAKYQAGKSNLNATYVSVSTSDEAPLKGKGYGYPKNGEIRIDTKKPDPSIPDGNRIFIKIGPTTALNAFPDGTRVQIEIRKADGSIDTALGYSWADIEKAATDYIETKKLVLPEGYVDPSEEN
ncbi:MAG: hypothetical protein EOO68_04745 [Moraxellaceae bacterium]|jgi:hypothetical protein|nr:MAG: hypothetical protein EOO68_04745 [Moraxellaceae bacterium]